MHGQHGDPGHHVLEAAVGLEPADAPAELLRQHLAVQRRRPGDQRAQQRHFPGGEVAAVARTFHQRAIAEGRFYEERVAASLSDLVFGQVFPGLARAISAAESDVPLPEVREAALLLLYRLLFILYAEDRDLLPVGDGRYDDYALLAAMWAAARTRAMSSPRLLRAIGRL